MATLVLLFLLIFSSHVNAEWIYLLESKSGDTYYIDSYQMHKTDTEIYFSLLNNYHEPTQEGNLSSITYRKSDCVMPRKHMILHFMTYNQPFGQGKNTTTFSPPKKWEYLKPDTVHEGITNHVCSL